MRFRIQSQALVTLAHLSMAVLLVPGSAFATDSCVMSATLIPSDSFSIGDASNPDFVISTDQKIGIGTASPAAQVHIVGALAGSAFQVQNANSHILFDVNLTDGIKIGTNATTTKALTINASRLNLHQRLTVSGGTTQIDGNLSINTNPGLGSVPTVVLPVGMQVGSPPLSPNTDSSRLTPTFSVKGTSTNSFVSTGPSSVMTIHKNGGTGTLLNVKTDRNGGWVGLNQDRPTNSNVALDVGGTVKIQGPSIRFKPLNSAPFRCDSSNIGALALTSLYVICTCNGTSWINGFDATACVWR